VTTQHEKQDELRLVLHSNQMVRADESEDARGLSTISLHNFSDGFGEVVKYWSQSYMIILHRTAFRQR
jgi:hypothetical protein